MSIIRTAERRREPILVLICATVISSCGDDGASTQPTSAMSEATVPVASADPSASGGVDGPVVYAAAPSEPGVFMAALGIGTVELVGQCLLLEGSDAVGRPVIVWPFGTTWSDDESEVILPDLSAVPIGSTISAGGGFLGAGGLGLFLSNPEALERVADCVEYDGGDNVFVLQEVVEITS